MRTAAICPTCATYTNAVCVIYDGPAILSNIPANPNNDLDTILVALNTTLGTIDTNINNRVPYTGATANVNLGGNNLTANNITANSSLYTNEWRQIGNGLVSTYDSFGNQIGIGLNYPQKKIRIGDFNGIFTSTEITVDYLNEIIYLAGSLNVSGSVGSFGQVLTSNGTNVDPEWKSIPIPTINQVLTSGNTATDKDLIINTTGVGNIKLDGTTYPLLQVDSTIGGLTYQSIVGGGGLTSKDVTNNIRGDYSFSQVEYLDINNGESTVITNPFPITTSNTLTYPTGTGTLVISANGDAPGTDGDLSIDLQSILDEGHSLTNGRNFQGTNAGSGSGGFEIVALGENACRNNTGSNINAFGFEAADSNDGSNINAFGQGAGQNNQLSGMTIFSNLTLPTYADHAAAILAITVPLGATAGCTYLYHNQATNSIGAVRL